MKDKHGHAVISPVCRKQMLNLSTIADIFAIDESP